MFDDAEVIHVEDRVDPVDDIEIITRELRLKDISALQRIVADIRKQIPRGLKKEQKEELASAEKVLAWVQEGKEIRNGMDVWTVKDCDFLNENQFLSAKPVVYLVNLSPEDFVRKKNKWLAKINEWVNANGGGKIIPFSGKIETDLLEMPEDERAKYMAVRAAQSSAVYFRVRLRGVDVLQSCVLSVLHWLSSLTPKTNTTVLLPRRTRSSRRCRRSSRRALLPFTSFTSSQLERTSASAGRSAGGTRRRRLLASFTATLSADSSARR